MLFGDRGVENSKLELFTFTHHPSFIHNQNPFLNIQVIFILFENIKVPKSFFVYQTEEHTQQNDKVIHATRMALVVITEMNRSVSSCVCRRFSRNDKFLSIMHIHTYVRI
jgi:hypothetical protein